MERAAKKEAVDALNEVFKATSVAVVAHYSGLTVAQMQKLRTQMKQAGASVKVSKNRLAKIALEGTDVVAIGSLLKGPTVIATSDDPVAALESFALETVLADLSLIENRIERLDRGIAESEQRITEQLFLIMTKEAMGEDTAVAKRTLKALQGIYVEYRRARKLFAEATRAIDPPSAP